MSSTDSHATVQRVFSCTVAQIGPQVIVEVIGEIDGASAGQFRTQMLSAAKEHPRAIVVDMTNASLLDTKALAVLVEVWRFTQEHGIDLTVEAPGPSVRAAFDVAPSGLLVTLR